LWNGAELIVDGRKPAGLETGYYVAPTLLGGCKSDMTVVREEIFGPVIVTLPFDDEEEAIAIATDGTAGLHLSLDMDFCDPVDAPGVGTPVRGGATYREAHLALEMICDSRHMVSMEVVEVNPVIDERNRTADFAVELIMSGLGKRIL